MAQISFVSLFITTLAALFVLLCIKNKQYRWIALLAGSLLFYWLTNGFKIVWVIWYGLLVYGIGFIANKKDPKDKWLYYAGIAVSLIPLIAFKLPQDFSFLNTLINVNAPLEYRTGIYKVAELLGISFITFNAVSYLADISRGYLEPQRNYFVLLLYLIFFPHVLSGPLHRAKNLFNQFENNIGIKSVNLSLAFRCVLIGCFKSFVLAERLLSINTELSKEMAKGLYVLIEGASFFLYLYCVFSSFVDISRGISKLFGVELDMNFENRVYAASGRQQFWKGWHVTLNNWFRDYFFFPLAKKMKGRFHTNIALFVCFVLIGLWHGISWQFLLWGCLNGIWILLEIKFAGHFEFIGSKYRKWLGWFYHLFFASLLALLFSSQNLFDTWYRLTSATWISAENLGILKRQSVYVVVLFGLLDIFYRLAKDKKPELYIGELKPAVRWGLYFFIGAMVLVFGIRMGINNYYFKF